MKNRLASLFQLEALLAPPAAPANGRARRPASRKQGSCPPSSSAPTVSHSFDTGAPIHCQHDIAYPAVERAAVPDPGDAMPRDAAPPARASAFDLHVEAFEDETDNDGGATIGLTPDDSVDEPLTLRLSDHDQWQTPAPADERDHIKDDRSVAEGLSAQMAAVEADLAELAARADHPPPNAPTPADETDSRAAAATPAAGKGHAVFDSMAEGMSYATEFRLPSLQLSQVFSALDRELDTSGRATVPDESAPRDDGTPTVAGDVLLADLARLTSKQRTDAERFAAERVVGERVVGERVVAEPQALATAIDVRHDVQLIPQQTGMSCWAAGAAMIVGWRDKVSVDPSEIARATGYWAQYANGLDAEDTSMFATWRLRPEAAQSYTVQGFADLLRRFGPLWVASAEPGPHIRVVTGMVGDGTAAGTHVLIHDPWEAGMTIFRLPNAGATYRESYQRFVEKQESLGRQEAKQQGIYVAHA